MVKVSQRVLCVDDQQEILDLLQRHLAKYDCDFVTSGQEALAALYEQGPYAVILCDYSMPEMNGTELLREFKTRSPDTVSLMLTAHDDLEVAVDALHEGQIFRFLTKPWERQALEKHLDAALEQYRVITTERMLSEALTEANRSLQKRLEQLEELNQLVEYWVEFSPAVIFSLQLAGGRLKPGYVSKNFPRLTGYERTELIVKPEFWRERIHPEDAERVAEALREFLDGTDTTHSIEYRFRHRDGDYRWIYEACRAVRAADGSVIELVGAWMDVTDSKREPVAA